jgi:hypothetical protein
MRKQQIKRRRENTHAFHVFFAEAFPGLHWFDRSSFEEGGKGTGSHKGETKGAGEAEKGTVSGAGTTGEESSGKSRETLAQRGLYDPDI